MKTISDILFIISNGLLIPVILLLLYLSVRAIWILFTFYNDSRHKREIALLLKQLVRNYSPDVLASAKDKMEQYANSPVASCFLELMEKRDDKLFCDHLLSTFQVDVQKELAKYNMLVKFGPMLGLMGTLIPMGPALVGLAGGDILSMAYNMQVAFATTVVGMASAAIGLLTLQTNKRFYAGSLNDLEFLRAKITEQ